MPRFHIIIGDYLYLRGQTPPYLYTIRDRPLFYLRGQTPFIFANQVMAEPISPNRYGDRPLNFYRAEPNYPGLVRGQTPHFLMEIDFFIADTDLLFLIPTVSGEVEKIPVTCTKLNSHF